ncbi:hypothetical protein [Komarekiella delphini-convector]|uniref:hypothetical protein n=1 Tax=Komarekiella delphini-convector TaxID=3050158 RepID=UPI00178103AC|nr:hypothetical protein [Komarekiella delphini-convector]
MTVAPLEWLENPWCDHCLKERMQKPTAQSGATKWFRSGHYIVFTHKPETLSSPNNS